MDKIEKELRKLDVKERKAVKEILYRVLSKDYTSVDIRKLKGRKDIFRIRKGNIRIIYRQSNGDIYILTIERRGDTIYKKL